MRYWKSSETILSEDTANQPKDIRFSKDEEIVDLVTLKDGGGETKTYQAGTHVIDMGQISEGRWAYIKSDKEIDAVIDGSATPLTLIPNKPTELWAKFSSISLITTEATRITIAIAGE